MIRSLMIVSAPVLALGPCPKSEATAVKATTNSYVVRSLDVHIDNDLVSVNGVRAKKKNDKQMTELCMQLYDDANGNGNLDTGETTETPYYVGDGSTPTDELEIGTINFRYGKQGSQKMNAFKGYVMNAEGKKERFEGPIK